MISLSLVVVGAVMVATGESFVSLLAGRIIAGTGGISLVIICPQGIAHWFRGKEVGVAMGVFNTAMPVGVILSLNVLPALASRLGWRPGIWTTVVFTAAAFIVFALFFGQPSREAADGGRETRPGLRGFGSENVSIGLVALSWSLFNASIISLFTFTPDFMVDTGLALSSAGFDTSLVMAGALILSPVIGYVLDRIGRQELFIAVGGLGTAMLLLLVPGGKNHFPLLMVAIGVAAALTPARRGVRNPLYA
jgi:predicted MFS family arabinose efflux permease